ncbi:putative nucleotide-binding protein, containing PIN domain [bacterium BMS3Abin08]|nr:putative nucleotide-binding protein, containing PIN domain [bacterium BMS3Abin08]
MEILKSLERLAVDANPILSAVIGGNARNIFAEADTTVFYTTLFNFKEVEKYIPVLSDKRGIPLDDLYLALSLLPLTVCDEDFYKKMIPKARKLIAKRDPKDIHILALSLKLECSLWSNDKDFENLGKEVYQTLDLLKLLNP